MILAWLILNPLRFLACEALMILIVRTSFMSFRLTGNRIDLGLPEPIGVTRINCLIFRFPLHVILRTFIVLLSADATWICCCFGAFSETKGFISRYICRYFQRDLISLRNRTLSGIFRATISSSLSTSNRYSDNRPNICSNHAPVSNLLNFSFHKWMSKKRKCVFMLRTRENRICDSTGVVVRIQCYKILTELTVFEIFWFKSLQASAR